MWISWVLPPRAKIPTTTSMLSGCYSQWRRLHARIPKSKMTVTKMQHTAFQAIKPLGENFKYVLGSITIGGKHETTTAFENCRQKTKITLKRLSIFISSLIRDRKISKCLSKHVDGRPLDTTHNVWCRPTQHFQYGSHTPDVILFRRKYSSQRKYPHIEIPFVIHNETL